MRTHVCFSKHYTNVFIVVIHREKLKLIRLLHDTHRPACSRCMHPSRTFLIRCWRQSFVPGWTWLKMAEISSGSPRGFTLLISQLVTDKSDSVRTISPPQKKMSTKRGFPEKPRLRAAIVRLATTTTKTATAWWAAAETHANDEDRRRRSCKIPKHEQTRRQKPLVTWRARGSTWCVQEVPCC